MTYIKTEKEKIDILLAKMKENSRAKAEKLIHDFLYEGEMHTDIYDLEYCFADAQVIEYLEFDSKEEAAAYFSNQKQIKNLVLVISQAEEMLMTEVAEITQAIKTNNDVDILFSLVYKNDSSLIRILLQSA